MLACFTLQRGKTKKSTPIFFVEQKQFSTWLKEQNSMTQHWLGSSQFRGEAGNVSLIPGEDGKLEKIICCVANFDLIWNAGNLPMTLPEGLYHFEVDPEKYENLAMGWGLGAYQFTRYKKAMRQPAQLILPKKYDNILNIVESIYLTRDLINTPTDDLGPSELADVFFKLGKTYKAKTTEIVGEDLLKKNFPAIYTVGRACDDAPRLLDLRWGNKKHRKITLVGKGVCFDSGGLDIKPASAMMLMKKDMGGAAHVLGLARMIMQAKLPIYLRVLIPAVENSISGNAYRPGDVVTSRKGLTIEIGNTDAEGRVVLADALTEAASEKPDLIIDIATLTGAARVALGTELPALFSNCDDTANNLLNYANKVNDPMWRLPLFTLYRDLINSPIADINNSSADSYAGAITAALFLKEFVPDDIPWLHFDLMAWNLKARPGRPQGGEAMGLRALFKYVSATDF